ncbi:MAG: transglycosylase SLT domain-containing protein [Pseudomonadota bacterium]
MWFDKHLKNTAIQLGLIAFLSVFLISFSSPIDSREDFDEKLEPMSLLTEADVLRADPLKNNAWDLFHPSWRPSSVWETIRASGQTVKAIRDPFEEASTNLEVFLDDPSNRLEQEFKIPPAMRSRVSFWLQIFGRFTSQTKIIHDRYRPEVIYGYIDFRPHFRATSSAATATYRSDRTEREILRGLKIRMREAAGLTDTQLLTDFERERLREILQKVGGLDEKGINKALRNVRTQTGQKDHFLSGLKRSESLLPRIEAVFKGRNLPIGLTRIPFVESSFNPNAFSRIGAIGLWQFIRRTARQMIHQDATDKWRDPLAQSQAAARMLKLNRSALPDWGIAITAYNSGVGRMRRLIQKYGVSSVEELEMIPTKEDFGFAGRNFFAEVLAVNLLETYKDILFERELGLVAPYLVYNKN